MLELKNLEQKEDYRPEDFLEPEREWRRLFAECWGTFLLVLVGAGAIVVSHLTGQVSKAMEVVAPGLTVMTVIYFMGAVSGAHINPAVSIAFALRRHFPWKRVPLYILAQLFGAVLAAAFLKSLFGNVGDVGATVPHLEKGKAFIVEVVLTTGLVNTILGTASGPRNVGPNGAIAIGAYIALAGLWAGPLTGASMNAARSLGPDLVRGNLSTTWIYVMGSLCGAVMAVGFEWILKGSPSAKATKEAQGDGSKNQE